MLSANFIITTLFYWNQPFKQQPLTHLYLATILDEHFQNKDVFAEVTDLRGLEKDQMHSGVKESDIYFYSVASPDYAEVYNLVNILRAKYPKSKHLAGGAHVNIFPEETSEFFDAIVLGDGEQSILEAVKDIQGNKLKKIYSLNAEYGHKKYPFPRRHYLPRDKIVKDNLIKCRPGIPGTSTLFSHGCPFSCSFCANYNKRKRFVRTNEEISEEIKYLKENYGIKALGMLDEICIPLNKKEAVLYIENLARHEIFWRGQSRIGIDPKILNLARKSGCLELNIGVESVSQEVINLTNKGIKIEDVKTMIKDCKANDIKVFINLVNGLPGEPKDITQRTIDFIEEVKPDLVNLFSLCLYPGSPLYQNPEKYGINPATIIRDYDKMNHMTRRFNRTTDNLDNLILFEYFPEGHSGKALSKKEIITNYETLQKYIIKSGLNK